MAYANFGTEEYVGSLKATQKEVSSKHCFTGPRVEGGNLQRGQVNPQVDISGEAGGHPEGLGCDGAPDHVPPHDLPQDACLVV